MGAPRATEENVRAARIEVNFMLMASSKVWKIVPRLSVGTRYYLWPC
jgi:hypothetical protein